MLKTKRIAALGLLLALTDAMGQPVAGLEWQSTGSVRAAPVHVAPSAGPGFTQLPAETTGIRFTNTLSYDKSVANQNFLNGAGVAAGDYDGDGWPDLYFCNLEGSNKLYRNLGHWTFEDVTDRAGVNCGAMASTG